MYHYCAACGGAVFPFEVFVFTGPYSGYYARIGWECPCVRTWNWNGIWNVLYKGLVECGKETV